MSFTPDGTLTLTKMGVGQAGRGRIAKIAKPTIEISDKVRLNLEKFV
jgi:hypothetical protein